MKETVRVLFTGATGYIGGSVLARLLEHPNISSLHITAVVRNGEKAQKLKQLGVNVVVGSHNDPSLVETLAAEADVVITAANVDDLEAAQAILRGLKQRYSQTKIPAIVIHTSGTGVLTDDAKGLHPTDTVYDDADAAQMASLAPTQMHRNVDLELLKADEEGYIKSYIILPSTIYGVSDHKLTQLGIANDHSQQIPLLVGASLKRGQAGMVGEGKNIWPNVHIDDTSSLYMTLFDAIVAGNPAATHGKEGYYFGESGHHTLYEISKRIAEVMHELGLTKSSSLEPTSFTKEDIDKYFDGSDYLGTNSRCKATRSRSIGWKPTHSTKDMLDSIRAEVEALAGDKL